MTTNTQALGGKPLQPKLRKGYWRRMGGKFLILSVAAHLLFFTGAAYYVIQIFVPKRLTFKSGVPSTNPSRAIAQHKVSSANQRKRSSAPAPAKRVVTTGFASIILPPMPVMPSNVVNPTQMVGMGGLGLGFGQGNGTGNGNGDGNGNGFTAPFGTKTAQSGMLVGQYYDFKFTRSGQPSNDFAHKYAEMINEFVDGGWNESKFSRIYKGPTKLYTPQIFFPIIDTAEGPHEFGNKIANNEGGRWVAVYRGTVSPPESGTYYFVGAGDDDMIVNFNGQNILHNCEHIKSSVTGTGEYHAKGMRNKFERSKPVIVTAGQFYEIKILIGDDTPAKMMAMLLVEKEGVNYGSDEDFPIIPVFSLAGGDGSPAVVPGHYEDPGSPTHLENAHWRGKASNSLLDMLDQ